MDQQVDLADFAHIFDDNDLVEARGPIDQPRNATSLEVQNEAHIPIPSPDPTGIPNHEIDVLNHPRVPSSQSSQKHHDGGHAKHVSTHSSHSEQNDGGDPESSTGMGTAVREWKGQAWTNEEKHKLRKMMDSEEGHTSRTIAETLGRPVRSVFRIMREMRRKNSARFVQSSRKPWT